MPRSLRDVPKHDVIIVGGGPAGFYAGQRLAARGWNVRLFEEHQQAGEPVHCTGVLAVEAFDEFDVARDSVLNSLSTVRFVAPSGASICHTTASAEAVVIDRRVFDCELLSRAVQEGVEVTAGLRVNDLVVDDRTVTARLSDGSEVQARACVLACGANYTFQRRLGLGMPGVFLQSAQIEVPAAPRDVVEVHFGEDVAPRGFAWAVPVSRPSGSFARVGLMCDGNARHQFTTFTRRIAASWGLESLLASGSLEPRQKILPLSPITRTYTDRVLAVGDAAGLVKATTGGGIYYSLISASFAADVLDQRLASGALRSADLAEYEQRWRTRLGPELDAQMALRQVANGLSDGAIEDLFELARTDGIMPIVRSTARFNRHRDFIVSLLKHPPARRVLFRRVWRSA